MSKIPAFLMLASLIAGTAAPLGAAEISPVYELRIYTAAPGKFDALLARFRDHTRKLIERHGMHNIAYWTPIEAKDGAGEKLYYLLEHRSREAAKASWAAFDADPEWQAAKKATEADGKLVAGIESFALAATPYSPRWQHAASPRSAQPRVFELRWYTAAEGKLDALHARFRDHTIGLFRKHGMTNVLYTVPIDPGQDAGRTLIYFLAHENREAQAKSFAGFRADPDWIAARTASEKDGRLTAAQGGVKSILLEPTDFSPLK